MYESSSSHTTENYLIYDITILMSPFEIMTMESQRCHKEKRTFIDT